MNLQWKMQLFVNIFSPNIMSTWFHLVRLCFVLVFFAWFYTLKDGSCSDSLTLRRGTEREREREMQEERPMNRDKAGEKKEISVQTKSLDCCVIVCEWLNNVWGARLVKQCFAVGTSLLLHFQVCVVVLFPCVLLIFPYSFHFYLFPLSLGRSLVYARVCTPLKWFFDMLDNEHLIMLTCVYY